MKNRKSNNRAPLLSPMHIALLLLCAVLLSSYAISGLYARYISEESGADSARVIRFGDISIIEPNDNNLILTPGVTSQNRVMVDFKGSESATYVFVIIDAPNWTYTSNNTLKIGNLVTLSVMNDWTYLKKEETSFVFYKELAPNTVLNQVELFAEQADGVRGAAVASNATAQELAELNGKVSFSVKAIVVQSIGFENVTEAWNSVKAK